MRRPAGLLALACIPLLLAVPRQSAHAAWRSDGTPIAQFTGEQLYPRLAPDARGGVFVTWDQQNASRIQRLTANGDAAPGWPAVGLMVPPAPLVTTHYAVWQLATVPDGAGGVYVLEFAGDPCGAKCIGDPGQLHLQRLTADGAVSPGWPEDGAIVSTARIAPLMAPSGYSLALEHGGVIVSWFDPRDLKRLYVQAISVRGTRSWGDLGVAIDAGGTFMGVPALVGDGDGGALVFWNAVTPNVGVVHIAGQHVSARGALMWPKWGISVALSRFVTSDGPQAVPDGHGGAIVAWSGAIAGRTSGLDIAAMRIAADGSRAWPRELPICAAPGEQGQLFLAPAEHGDAIAVWRDARSGASSQVRAQRITRAGQIEWLRDGVAVCAATGEREVPVAVDDDAGGAYFVWGDTRAEAPVFASHLTPVGLRAPGWPIDGVPMGNRTLLAPGMPDEIEGLAMTATGRGTAIAVWTLMPPAPGALSGGFEQGFAMRLMPEGPAATPGGAALGGRVMAAVAPAMPLTFALGGVRPNPMRSGGIVQFTLPDARPARLELFDVTGRRVWTRDVGELGPGQHDVRLGDGAWMPPGLYLVRLSQGERNATARMTIAR